MEISPPDRVGWKNQIWEGDRAEGPTDSESAEKFEYGTIHFVKYHWNV